MSAPYRQYQGETAEQRIHSRRQALMDLALSALIDDQWRSLSISELCRRGGLHKRYFYESFSSLDDVVGALIEDFAGKIVSIAFVEAAAATQAGKVGA